MYIFWPWSTSTTSVLAVSIPRQYIKPHHYRISHPEYPHFFHIRTPKIICISEHGPRGLFLSADAQQILCADESTTSFSEYCGHNILLWQQYIDYRLMRTLDEPVLDIQNGLLWCVQPTWAGLSRSLPVYETWLWNYIPHFMVNFCARKFSNKLFLHFYTFIVMVKYKFNWKTHCSIRNEQWPSTAVHRSVWATQWRPET